MMARPRVLRWDPGTLWAVTPRSGQPVETQGVETGGLTVSTVVIRRCDPDDWHDVRRLHIKLALGLPLVVDVDLNEVLATPDDFWRDYVRACATEDEQALFVALADGVCVGMGHVRRQAPVARLSMLYVDGSRRREGIATALVTAQEQWTLGPGIATLWCHIPDVSAAVPLATALGWHRTDEVFHTRHRIQERKWTKEGRLQTAPARPPRVPT